MPTSMLTPQGQVTIPAEIRQRLGLEDGERLRIEVDLDGKIVLVPEGTAREQPQETDPEVVTERALSLLAEGSHLAACDLARAGAARFPNHDKLQKLWWALDSRGKSRPSSLPPEPPTDEEFAWLRNPPEWARGKWVALVGSEAVAVGETLREVSEAIRSQKLLRRPLVHRVD